MRIREEMKILFTELANVQIQLKYEQAICITMECFHIVSQKSSEILI